MFTGIIEERGKVLRVKPDGLLIGAKKTLEQTKIGDSIAVNGVCLTVTELDEKSFMADVMPETFLRSSLGELKPGASVNLERAMAADGRFGGHIVSGHIDGTGRIETIQKDGNAVRYRITASSSVMCGIVEKGSVAIDGISLTVSMAQRERFEVSVIPHTQQETTLCEKRPGSVVNLETDVIGKYVKRLMDFEGREEKKETTLTKEFLFQAGF